LLANKKIAHRFRNYTKEPLSSKEIRALLRKLGVKALAHEPAVVIGEDDEHGLDFSFLNSRRQFFSGEHPFQA